MSASIAAIALPVAAMGSFAAKTLSTAIGGFGDLLSAGGARKGDATSSEDAAKQLAAQLAKFQNQLASRIRNSGVPSDRTVEVHLDEFGLLRAYSQGQENTDLSRWLSGESDLVRQFADLQTQVAPDAGDGSFSVQIDLAASSTT